MGSEDKKKFKAHKVVLSACSPLFKSIICESDLSGPIIYLRGIQSLEIESILQFIYLGEASFYQERMNEFLNVAKSLEVKKISKGMEIPENEQHHNDESQDFDLAKELQKVESIPVQNSIPNKEIQLKRDNENKYPCEQCNYKATRSTVLQQHIKSIHEG